MKTESLVGGASTCWWSSDHRDFNPHPPPSDVWYKMRMRWCLNYFIFLKSNHVHKWFQQSNVSRSNSMLIHTTSTHWDFVFWFWGNNTLLSVVLSIHLIPAIIGKKPSNIQIIVIWLNTVATSIFQLQLSLDLHYSIYSRQTKSFFFF